jgi:predicted transcriptional regulator
MDDTQPHVIGLAVDIVSAYVSNNSIPVSELPALISGVHGALTQALSGASSAAAEAPAEKPTAAQIRKSIAPDHLVSFIDGKSYKTLKRHLAGHGLDAFSYRQRYGLPSDYPMVAASYAAQRSEIAKAIGLGRPGSQRPPEAPERAAEPAPVEENAPKGRGGRRPKAESAPEAEAAPVRAAARSARKDPSRKAA